MDFLRVLSILLMIYPGILLSAEVSNHLPTTTVVFSPSLKIEAELAYTDETRMHGLMNRTFLAEDAGMLFLFPNLEQQGFWMKNTLIPLDIIWLNERKEIVYFVTAQPCKANPCASYRPMQKAKYVLEVNAGFVKKHNLKLGNHVEFDVGDKGDPGRR